MVEDLRKNKTLVVRNVGSQKSIMMWMPRDQIQVFLKGGKCCKEVKYIMKFIYLFISSLISMGPYCVPDTLISAGDTKK